MVVDAFGGGASRNSLEVDLHRVLEGSRERDLEQEVAGVLGGACVRDRDGGRDSSPDCDLELAMKGSPGCSRSWIRSRELLVDAPSARLPRILGITELVTFKSYRRLLPDPQSPRTPRSNRGGLFEGRIGRRPEALIASLVKRCRIGQHVQAGARIAGCCSCRCSPLARRIRPKWPLSDFELVESV